MRSGTLLKLMVGCGTKTANPEFSVNSTVLLKFSLGGGNKLEEHKIGLDRPRGILWSWFHYSLSTEHFASLRFPSRVMQSRECNTCACKLSSLKCHWHPSYSFEPAKYQSFIGVKSNRTERRTLGLNWAVSERLKSKLISTLSCLYTRSKELFPFS